MKNNSQAIFELVFSEIEPFRELISSLAKAAGIIHTQGWAEANAGNVSIKLGKLLQPYLREAGFGDSVSPDEWYLVSRTGSRYRELAEDPQQALMLIRAGEREEYTPSFAQPTSEWRCHRQLHEKNSHPEHSCILHTHPTELIALSSTKLYADEQLLNRTLYNLLPELNIFLPAGIATTPFAPAGSAELAELSCCHIAGKQALIWERHGLLVLAEDPDKALDLTEVVNKAARLFFLLNRLV